MSIFRRGTKAQEPQQDPDEQRSVQQGSVEAENVASDQPSEQTSDLAENGAVGSAGGEPGTGPFDAADMDLDQDDRLDLGALRIRGLPGMELRLEVDETAQQVVAATAVMGESAVQLQAFAAPKTAGIWDSIRSEIAESIVAQGGTADEGRGDLGVELRTRMPSAGPDGRTVFAPALFTGVDGPRWFLRAVFSGRAAIDAEAAAPLVDVVRDTVVVRGDAAMAPREMLLLKLPDQAADGEQDAAEQGDAQQGEAQQPNRRSDDLKPFERGPEITEVR